MVINESYKTQTASSEDKAKMACFHQKLSQEFHYSFPFFQWKTELGEFDLGENSKLLNAKNFPRPLQLKKLTNSKSLCLLVLIVQSLEQRPVTEIFIEKVPNGNEIDDGDDDNDDADDNDDVDESNADEDDDDGTVFSDFDEDG